jgi:hypothetical protein
MDSLAHLPKARLGLTVFGQLAETMLLALLPVASVLLLLVCPGVDSVALELVFIEESFVG